MFNESTNFYSDDEFKEFIANKDLPIFCVKIYQNNIEIICYKKEVKIRIYSTSLRILDISKDLNMNFHTHLSRYFQSFDET